MAGSWTNERTGDVPTASYGSRATLVLMQALGVPVWVRYKKKSRRGCRLESIEWKRQANKGSKYHGQERVGVLQLESRKEIRVKLGFKRCPRG